MTDFRRSAPSDRRLEAAVRRAVGVKFARPSLRSLLRACSVYANVIAAVVALGLPTAGVMRRAANTAMGAFEASVRNFGDNASLAPLESPVDLSGVTETVSGAPESAETPFVAPAAEPSPEIGPPSETFERETAHGVIVDAE